MKLKYVTIGLLLGTVNVMAAQTVAWWYDASAANKKDICVPITEKGARAIIHITANAIDLSEGQKARWVITLKKPDSRGLKAYFIGKTKLDCLMVVKMAVDAVKKQQEEKSAEKALEDYIMPVEPEQSHAEYRQGGWE